MRHRLNDKFLNSISSNELYMSTDDKTETIQEQTWPEHALYTQKYLRRTSKLEWTCSICRKGIEAVEMKDKVECRVCRGSFHLKCVRRQGLCNESVCMRNDSSVGWSCQECDVFGLLRDEEKEEISDLYDKIFGKEK